MGRRAGRRRLTRREKMDGGRRSEVGNQRSEIRSQKDAEKEKIRSISPETRKMVADISGRFGLRINDIII